MNNRRIDCQQQVQQNHGLINDYTLEFANRSSQLYGTQQPWNMEIGTQPPAMEGGSQYRPSKLSSTIMSRFESPASAFYATERYMGFSRNEYEAANPPLCSQFSKNYDSQIPSYQSPRDEFSFDPVEQTDPNYQFTNTLQSHLSSNQYYSPVKPCKIPGSNLQGSHLSIPFDGNEDLRVCHNPSNPPLSKPSSGGVHSSKTRIRWTQDLHEKFVECVNRLGGAERATPKAILNRMDSDGLTIFHVKSHLQKYRIAKYMPESAEGKSEKRNSMNDVPQLDVKTGMQIKEALQLQLDVQRRLHEQLEIQRSLQLRIEEQGKQLKMMFDQQQKTSKSLLNTQNLEDVTSSDDPSVSPNDVQISIAEDSENTHFPSKIS